MCPECSFWPWTWFKIICFGAWCSGWQMCLECSFWPGTWFIIGFGAWCSGWQMCHGCSYRPCTWFIIICGCSVQEVNFIIAIVIVTFLAPFRLLTIFILSGCKSAQTAPFHFAILGKCLRTKRKTLSTIENMNKNRIANIISLTMIIMVTAIIILSDTCGFLKTILPENVRHCDKRAKFSGALAHKATTIFLTLTWYGQKISLHFLVNSNSILWDFWVWWLYKNMDSNLFYQTKSQYGN